MNPLKLTRIGRNRLFKLIGFLEKLPREQFDFTVVVRSFDHEHNCGSVCCAVGWMPRIFPRLAEWQFSGLVKLRGGESPEDYSSPAATIFGLPEHVAFDLFAPAGQLDIHPDLPSCFGYATPKQVAKMLRKFITLADAGKIKC